MSIVDVNFMNFDYDSDSSDSSLSSLGSDLAIFDTSALTPGYHPTCGEVFRVRFTLLRYLPLELVDMILDHAQYYPRIHSNRSRVYLADATTFSQDAHDARLCYLITPPIPVGKDISGTRTEAGMAPGPKMKKVRFWVKGCDQGWGGEFHHRGTYHGSYTWWEAAILRPAQVADSISSNPPPQSTLGSGPISPARSSSENRSWNIRRLLDTLGAIIKPSPQPPPQLPPDLMPFRIAPSDDDNPALTFLPGYAEVVVDGCSRWLIQRNVTSSSQVRKHEVVWDIQNSIETDGGEDIDTGKGRGRGFLHALRPGDSIAVVARALYPGWVNKVHAVAVEIFYFV